MYVFISLRQMPVIGVAEVFVKCMIYFRRNHQMISQSSCTVLSFEWQVWVSPLLSLPARGIVSVNSNHSCGHLMGSDCGFNLYSMGIKDVCYPFFYHALIIIWIPFIKYLFKSFVHLFVKFYFFLFLSSGKSSLYILVLCCMSVSWIFFFLPVADPLIF